MRILKFFEDAQDFGREAVRVILKIGEKLLLAAARIHIAQCELCRVVDSVVRSVGECGELFGNLGFVKRLLGDPKPKN